MNTGKLIIVTGPMAAGKDSVIAEYKEMRSEVGEIMSTTTRDLRPGEVQGNPYFFTQETEFLQRFANGDFLTSFLTIPGINNSGESVVLRYGNEKQQFLDVLNGRTMIWRISMDGAAKAEEVIRESFGEETAQNIINSMVKVFIGVTRLTVLKDRAYARDQSSRRNFKSRIAREWQEWLKFKDYFSKVIINDDLDKAVEEFESYVNEENEA